MSRRIPVHWAMGIHRAIWARWGIENPEGYGIVFSRDGWALSGSTYRTPRGLYCFDVRKKNETVEVLFSRHKSLPVQADMPCKNGIAV